MMIASAVAGRAIDEEPVISRQSSFTRLLAGKLYPCPHGALPFRVRRAAPRSKPELTALFGPKGGHATSPDCRVGLPSMRVWPELLPAAALASNLMQRSMPGYTGAACHRRTHRDPRMIKRSTRTDLPQGRLARVVLDGEALTRLSPVLEADRAQAVADLQAENRFVPPGKCPVAAPSCCTLSIQQGRLVFDVRCEDDTPLAGSCWRWGRSGA